MTPHSHFTPDDELDDVVANFALRLEDGERPDVEDWCSRFPEHAESLRGLATNWSGMERLFRGVGLDGDGHLATGQESLPDPLTVEFLEALANRQGTEGRYEIRGQVGEGGMAIVRKAWDKDLRREIAMKMIRGSQRPSGGISASAPTLSRFVDEAQITGQLRHPGIVSVHEIGLDREGRIYFTMELVEGRDLSEIYKLLASGEEGWSRPRALGVIQRVCEAMAYAHSKGVVHRDLKPANIMVGAFGEALVMDWGLARVISDDGDDSSSNRACPSTHRQDLADSDTGPVLATMEGEVVGTPAYMPPEQAAGLREAVSEKSDIYAVGALLYELLAGHAPYLDGGTRVSRRELLEQIIAGPPTPLELLRRDVPAELTAIVEKATMRRPDDRYGSMLDMSSDLRAYLEGRVVSAHRTGAWVEAKKWVARNRITATAIFATLVVALIGQLLLLKAESRGRVEAQRLADGEVIEVLQIQADDLWPAVPAMIPRFEEWLTRAENPASRLLTHEAALASLREFALPAGVGAEARLDRSEGNRRLSELDSQIQALEEGHDQLAIAADVSGDHSGTVEARLGRLRIERERVDQELVHAGEGGSGRTVWRFADPAVQERHDAITAVVLRGREFTHEDPLIGDISSVEGRLRLAQRLSDGLGRRQGSAWRAAIESIANPEECPLYEGLQIAPQIGLMPLRRDPRSGLWEFHHLASGAPPGMDANGEYTLDRDTGVILVLVPPGVCVMGAMLPTDQLPVGPNIARGAISSEHHLDEVELEPFFLSKYEFTQGQWLAATGANPSTFAAPHSFDSIACEADLLHPVETVDHIKSADVLYRLGLRLPTEAQWEYTARAGTGGSWWTGDDPTTLNGQENLLDSTAARHGYSFPDSSDVCWSMNDGYPCTSPVNAFGPNPWGLHCVLGNVGELTADNFVVDLRWASRPGDGLRLGPQDFQLRVYRGGSYQHSPFNARVTSRHTVNPTKSSETRGLRPARPLDHPAE